jgi:transposase
MNFVGCDIAKDTFEASLDEVARPRRFTNSPGGYSQFADWIDAKTTGAVCVVLEATCVYHLPLANDLTDRGIDVLVANPTRAQRFAESQGLRHKSDSLDAGSLRRYGASLDPERQRRYRPDSKIINQLKALLNRLVQVEKDLQRERNRLEKCSFIPDSEPQARSVRRVIGQLEAEVRELEQDIRALIRSDQRLKRNEWLLRSITGIGEKTAHWLLPLLHDRRFHSARQLAAFLGLTPRHESSGKWVKRGRIPYNCDRRLRARFYYPAITASTHDPACRELYQRLISQGSTSKQALTAVMRKLVQIAYGVIKHQTEYDPRYAG